MKFFASKRYQRVTNLVLAGMLVVSTLTASVPFIFSQKANALSEVHTTSLPGGWDLSETRTAGHNSLVSNGLHVWTVPSTGSYPNEQSKAAGYYPTNFNLSAAGTTAIDFASYSGVRPSLQLGVDKDGNGTWDGYLVYEPWAYGVGEWWTSKDFGLTAGGGYTNMGTLAEYATANPNAKVTSIGYSLGSGVIGDAVITDLQAGGTTYTFNALPPATPTNPRFAEFACGGATNINSITPTWDAVPNAVSYNYRATLPNGAVYGPVSVANVTSINGPFGSEGISTFAVQAVDANGITSDWSSDCAANYDATTPNAPVAQNPNGWTNGASAFSWSIPADTGSALHYELQYSRTHPNNVAENGTISSNTNTYAMALADGPLFWHVRAVDAAGNVGPWSNLQSATIDATAPILNPSLMGGVLRGTQSISLNISEPYLKASAIRILNLNYSSVSATPGVSNQIGTGNPLNYTWNTKLVSDGTYKVQYSARDILDHSTSAFYDVVVDNTAPVINGVTYGTNAFTPGALINGSKTFTVSTTEANPYRTYVEVDVKAGNSWHKITGQYSTGTSANTATLNFNTVGLSETATYQLKISTDDAAGNHSGQAIPFTIDNTAPRYTIKSGSNYTIGSNGVYKKVSFALYDAHKIDKVTINGVTKDLSNNNYSDVNGVTKGVFGAVEGSNTLVIYDVAGNTTTYAFTIDTQGPDVVITSPVNGTTFGNNKVVNIAGSTGDAVSYTLSIGNTGETPLATDTGTSFTSYGWDTTGVATGSYIATLIGTDAAGNQSTSEGVINIDNTAPVVAIAAQTNTAGSQPTITGTVNDPNATLVANFNGTNYPVTNNAGAFSFTAPSALANGTYVFRLTATDANGNVSTQTANVVVAVTAPATNPATTVTPIITNPAAAAVLGATTDTPATGDTGVKGATDIKDLAAAANSDANKGTIFGLAWYWWILILAALALIAWFIIGAIRRRNEDQA